jgi:hypothetical protein
LDQILNQQPLSIHENISVQNIQNSEHFENNSPKNQRHSSSKKTASPKNQKKRYINNNIYDSIKE